MKFEKRKNNMADNQAKIKWYQNPTYFIYCAHCLSSWGDRMWTYATGIYLFALDHGKFRLAAIFGVLCGISVLLCGGLIGSWVDRISRLKAVKISLAIQNLCVAIAATAFYLYLWYCGISVDWSNKELKLKQQKSFDKQALHLSWEAMIVILGVMALLASTALKIAIEKDWVIIVADTKSGLASLNAVVRSIDLSCKILAPIAVGGIMSAFGLQVSAIFIAAWNIVSLFVEYALLKKVYNLVPRLAIKGTDDGSEREIKTTEASDKGVEMENMVDKKELNDVEAISQNVEEEIPLNDSHSEKEAESKAKEEAKVVVKVGYLRPKKIKKSCVQLVFGELIILIKGWKIYMKQRVVCAGLALACLYMTVLGFDSVTVAYIYSQGVNEALTGVCQGLGGLVGIFGTFLFTKCRKKIGLERTGLIGFNSEIIFLSLSVVSLFLPGTTFKPAAIFSSKSEKNLANNSSSDIYNYTTNADLTILPTINSTLSSSNSILRNNNQSYHSIIVFLCGIILSRAGLWIADLVVTQLLQENVVETERGLVNGVQNSLNSLLDMLKFILVLFFATPEVFGYLIILSYIFVSIGCMLYACYSYKTRGHLFPRKLKSFLLCRRSQKNSTKNSSLIYIGPPLQKNPEPDNVET